MSARSRHLPRRSCHAVPGSNPRFIERAPSLGADLYFLDLEDAVAPSGKEAARGAVASAVRTSDWGETVVCVRINGWSTPWTYRDVIEVVSAAGPRLDELMLPKVSDPGQVVTLDLLLAQVEADAGLPAGHIGLEVQIESALGLVNVEAICSASPRLEAVVLGPVDLSASLGMPSLAGGLDIPEYPGDYFNHVYSRLLIAGRAAGIQVIDGPYVKIKDLAGLRAYAARARTLGFDGKWSLHPDQIPVINELFTPSHTAFDRARAVLDAYRDATEGQGRGAVMLGDEMIDEASRQAALAIVAKGERAGLGRRD